MGFIKRLIKLLFVLTHRGDEIKGKAHELRRFAAHAALAGAIRNGERDDMLVNVRNAVEYADLLNAELWRTRHRVDEFLESQDDSETLATGGE